MKNIKYYAGFADADASLLLNPYKLSEGKYKVRVRVVFTQNTCRDWVLNPLCEEFGVNIHRTERSDIRAGKTYKSSSVTLTSNKAVRFLQQAGQHMVIKYQLAKFLQEVSDLVVDQAELKELRNKLKAHRDCIRPTHKTKVSRQWMAGYVDGDGCLSSTFNKRNGNIEFRLTVASNINDPQGLDLLHHNFKGYQTKKDKCMWWAVGLNKNNVEKTLGHFIQHLKLKRTQADLIMNTLRKGKSNQRSGGATWESNKAIHETLKQLKDQQRLSDLTVVSSTEAIV